jgi:single-stranded DNA-binding protein
LVIHCAGITVGFDKDDNGTLQTRKFTPRDGNQRTVYEVVARSAHQIVRRNGKEAASDNAPDAKDQVVPAPEEHVESTDDGEIWPS